MKNSARGGVLNRLDKNYPNFIHKLGYKFFACLATLVFILSTILLAFPELTNQKATDAFTSDNLSDAATVGEIWLGSAFDENNLNTLLKYVSGSETISTKDLSVLNNDTENINKLKGITAEQMRASTAGGKTAGKDIVVTFGGFTWTPTYLSKDKSGDLILTLWLSDSAQLEGKTYDSTRDPFDANGAATWNAGGRANDRPSDNYPDAMYGTSYMNAVVLNNGGFYKPDYSKDEIIEVQASEDHAFAAFTTGEIAPYLDTPSQVTWQEYGQDAISRFGDSYDCSNENWSTAIKHNESLPQDPSITYKFASSGNYNYAPKEHSDQWAESKLWLPSMSETGYADDGVGIWATSTLQRSNTGGSYNYYSWLRSGSRSIANFACLLLSSGSSYSTDCVYSSLAVRPALHLNLNAATGWTPPPPSLATTVNEFDENNASDPKYADIYKITTETGVDFHIKTAAGFLKLSTYTQSGGEFQPTWTFYLDNDIDITTVCDHFTAVGGEANPFLGKFDGQGHKITYSQKNHGTIVDPDFIPSASLFGCVGSSVFQNLNLNVDVQISKEEGAAVISGFILFVVDGSTCYITHINIEGNVYVQNRHEEGYESAIICTISNSDVYIYDIFSNINAPIVSQIINEDTNNVEINSCKAINIYCLVYYFYGGNVTLNNVYSSCHYMAGLNSGVVFGLVDTNLKCVECEFICEGATNLIVQGQGNVSMYDCVLMINAADFKLIMREQDSACDINMLGVYVATKQEDESYLISILDPNFTSSKWCMDPHLNDGLPQLRRFVSIADFMEQCDMAEWAKDKPTYEF